MSKIVKDVLKFEKDVLNVGGWRLVLSRRASARAVPPCLEPPVSLLHHQYE